MLVLVVLVLFLISGRLVRQGWEQFGSGIRPGRGGLAVSVGVSAGKEFGLGTLEHG
jgi:hypothetical protein